MIVPRYLSIKSPLYELIKTVECDLQVGDDGFSVRIELFRNITSSGWFRAHLWRTEFYRLQSTFPQKQPSGQPAHHPSDELIQIDWSSTLDQDYKDFQASDQEAALQQILDALRHFSDRMGG